MSTARTASLETLRLRARMLARARAFFAARGVLEVETPALSAAAPPDPAIESVAADVASLGGTHFLHTSPELAMKRLIAAGSGDIYQICRVFRDGELGRWHQPEFTMIEWYRVGWDDEKLMDEVEALVRDVAGAAPRVGSGASEEGIDAGAAGDVSRAPSDPARWPVERLAYRDAFRRALDVDPCVLTRAEVEAKLRARGVDVPAGLDGDELLDLALATAVVPSFEPEAWTFVRDYPATQAALACLKPAEPPVAARFELFARGLELANGFAELTDPVEQRRRFAADLATRRRRGQPLRPLDGAFLAALDAGLPPCAGVALGFDRLVAVAADLPSIAAATALAHRR